MSSGSYNQVILTWIDKNGNTATSFIPTIDQTSDGAGAYSALVDAFEACADAKVSCVQFLSTLRRTPTPAVGPYNTVWDRGVLFDRNSITSAFTRQAIVGPAAGIFRADTITIDLTNPQVMTLIAELQAKCGDSDGNPIGRVYRGKRQTAGGS